MKENNTDGLTEYIKYLATWAFIAAWIFAALMGFMLGIVPYSPGDEKDVLQLGILGRKWA